MSMRGLFGSIESGRHDVGSVFSVCGVCVLDA